MSRLATDVRRNGAMAPRPGEFLPRPKTPVKARRALRRVVALYSLAIGRTHSTLYGAQAAAQRDYTRAQVKDLARLWHWRAASLPRVRAEDLLR